MFQLLSVPLSQCMSEEAKQQFVEETRKLSAEEQSTKPTSVDDYYRLSREGSCAIARECGGAKHRSIGASLDRTSASPSQQPLAASCLGAMDYTSNVEKHEPLASPALSPAMLAKFPPTLLITGTRSFDMSAAVQTQRLLTHAGTEADLHLWDGMGHCFFFDVRLPESQEAHAVIVKFCETHLGAKRK